MSFVLVWLNSVHRDGVAEGARQRRRPLRLHVHFVLLMVAAVRLRSGLADGGCAVDYVRHFVECVAPTAL